jgi:hypothetical protein
MKKGAVVLMCLLFLATGGIIAYANPLLTVGAVTETAGHTQGDTELATRPACSRPYLKSNSTRQRQLWR